MTTDYRDLITRMAKELDNYRQLLLDDRTATHRLSDEARAALADGPAVPESREPASVTEQPSDEELWELYQGPGTFSPIEYAHDLLARRGNPTPPPADGEVAKSVAWLRVSAAGNDRIGATTAAAQLNRAAELLQRQVLVPVAVSDALIKAECALSDIAEGEPMTDEGDPLKWAERRCADTLAIIRPTMMQHKIRTSEWPPVAATAKPLPEVDE